MKTHSLIWICASMLTLLTDCALFTSRKAAAPPPKTTTEAPQLIGRIASIPADKRFVLIQTYGNLKLEAGTVLTTRGTDDRTANLLVTGEALSQFVAADLQSGLVVEGDAVYSRHAPSPTPPTPPAEAAENQSPTPTPNPPLQK